MDTTLPNTELSIESNLDLRRRNAELEAMYLRVKEASRRKSDAEHGQWVSR